MIELWYHEELVVLNVVCKGMTVTSNDNNKKQLS